ncbi:sigma-54 interaction domain-containing protein [Paludibacterium paludis]|uniref:Sigma-54-dependent Fis family transcriptional regulator n=1 Tax=Paludibacterium paludis TaxID=1225769 RepID=A0A918P6H4_9NEIS|nr:sigma 54-interacting transcriptional regulator [Paludibacterium paludis]GGY26197.1 sigma-54-dependent Fis family transcriptional regulator [Paludibacterium paludis]
MDPELRDALAMFAGFFDAVRTPVAVIDVHGRYVYYNEESAVIDGYTCEEALGQHVLSVYPEMTAADSTMLQSLYTGKEYRSNYQVYVNAAGKKVHYVHTTLPLTSRDGRIIGVIEMGRNLSLIHQMNDTLMDLQGQLQGRGKADVRIVTDDPGMLSLIEQARRLAQTSVPVLIYGETGTGKELFARLIHRHSSRADAPFVAVNCAAIPENLLESTLFGTVRGAFTGAEDRRGLLEEARHGTLFLDEINSMPLSVQGKLLRVLQEDTFTRVGSSREERHDARFIAASNESLPSMMRNHRVRRDLLYRLNVGYLKLPPLRERGEDVVLLARHFLARHCARHGLSITSISDAVLERLRRYPWPGNVRMLDNAILRSLILCETGDELDFILLDDAGDEDVWQNEPRRAPAAPLTTHLPVPMPGRSIEEQVDAYEKALLMAVLRQTECLSEAARLCHMPRTTLQYKMRKYGIRYAHSVIDDA